jgi:hypothetical protein
VDELPANRVAALACTVGDGRLVVRVGAAAHALAGAALDAPELLDVDVNQLARALGDCPTNCV